MQKLDKFDFSILQELQRDSSQSAGEIAEKIHISSSACWRRIKILQEQGIIQKQVAILDAKKLDLHLVVYISIRTNQHNTRWTQQFRQTVEALPSVLEVYRMSGDLDYLIKAIVKDMPDYDKLYQQLVEADLYDISASFVMEECKNSTELPII